MEPTNQVGIMLGAAPAPGRETLTARQAGGLTDMKLAVSPTKVNVKTALQNLAKAINLALQTSFIENELDRVYKAARVYKGAVKIAHKDYIGLGDGVFAKIGKLTKSFSLTLSGPDPASPEGKAIIEKTGGGSIRGLANFLGRKLNLIEEYENKVPTYVEQMLDRLEAASMIVGWDREEWNITTQVVGLDVIIRPAKDAKEEKEQAEPPPAE
jgi:hypothetical protein